MSITGGNSSYPPKLTENPAWDPSGNPDTDPENPDSPSKSHQDTEPLVYDEIDPRIDDEIDLNPGDHSERPIDSIEEGYGIKYGLSASTTLISPSKLLLSVKLTETTASTAAAARALKEALDSKPSISTFAQLAQLTQETTNGIEDIHHLLVHEQQCSKFTSSAIVLEPSSRSTEPDIPKKQNPLASSKKQRKKFDFSETVTRDLLENRNLVSGARANPLGMAANAASTQTSLFSTQGSIFANTTSAGSTHTSFFK